MKKLSFLFFLAVPIVFLIGLTLYKPDKPSRPKEDILNKIEAQNPKEIVDSIARDIETGEWETALSKMVENLKHPDIPTSEGQPLIVLVAEKNNYDLLAYLVDNGAEVNALDIYTGETALIKAARNGNIDMVTKLVAASANVNMKSQRGITALTEAANGKHGDITDYLLSRGALAGVSDENLLSYAFDKNIVGMEAMLRGGANANYADTNGNTALIVASSYGDLPAMQKLTAYKASVNMANKYGMTPLLYTIKGGFDEATRNLLSRNDVDINKANNNDQTPLFYAAYMGNTGIAQDLLELGADYKKADKKGITPLEIAQKRGHKETAKAISDFITVQNLPRDEKGRIIVKQKNKKISASSEKAMAAKMAQEKAVKQQEQLIKQAQAEQEKAIAQTKAMQDQMQKALAFGSADAGEQNAEESAK
jgi:ankyrin repeat protein